MPKHPSQCVNPVYLGCLEDWRDEIRAKNPQNKIINVVGKAITSLKTHAHVIHTPRECRPLPYFGEWIIRNLTERLDQLEANENARPAPNRSRKRPSLDNSFSIGVPAAAAMGVSEDQQKKTTRRRSKAPTLSGNPTNNVVKIPRAATRQPSDVIKTIGWDPHAADVVGGTPATMALSRPSSSRAPKYSKPSAAPSQFKARLPVPAEFNDQVVRPVVLSDTSKTAFPEFDRTTNAPVTTIGHDADAPVFLRASGKARRRPRLSSHVPAPPAIDQQLERLLDREAGLGVEDIDDEEPHASFSLPFTPTLYPAGSYDIIFILDHREVKTTKNREYVRDALARNRIPVERRALELGDMCWIARHRETKDEIILDFIIERKRIDDLVKSIKDGRFHEQKFRLKQSGISRVYYLVEEYMADCVHHSMDKAVFTALSSTQVIDGFFLKETRDIDDTIEYLVGLHHAIVSQYHGQALRVIPEHAIKRHSYTALITQLRNIYPDVTYHTTYTAFRELNKSGAFTLREVFARMLLCIRGMSAEKVANVLENYDTPRKLWEAFREAEEIEAHERELESAQVENEDKRGRRKKSQVIPARQMLTRLSANGRRQIKPALAEQIYDLFMSEEY